MIKVNQQAYRHSWDGEKFFYYHAYCVESHPFEGVVSLVAGARLEKLPLEHVPADAQCDFCYVPMHGEPKGGERA